MAQRRTGEIFAVRQHAQLLILDVLRAVSQDPDLPPGWMAAIADPQLGPALALLHERPAVSWTLAELARSCAMSRTTFAQRFRAVVGLPPRAYLIRWRMLLAQRDLTDGNARIGEVGAGLGYSSEGAFSSTFTREVGVAPSRYRSAARAGFSPVHR